MAYIINKFNGQQLIVLEDGTIDTSTSLGLVGRNYVGYGETQNENFVYLLENFANTSPPSRPLLGQIWFNSSDNTANVYNGTGWNPIGNATVSATEPVTPNLGALWVDSKSNQLKTWIGTAWREVGPEAVEGFGNTRARSVLLDDSDGNPRPAVLIETDDNVIAVCVSEAFTLNPNSTIAGLSNNLIAGINLPSTSRINGNVNGNAIGADRLTTPRLINNIAFDGQNNITVKASTTNKLLKGTYISGEDFDGSTPVTWSVDASSSNIIGKVVARNSEGGFSAGTITATFVGNLTGNVTATSGVSRFNTVEAETFIGATLTGNAFSASQLATPRKINGVNFDGTGDITVTADAGTLTGNILSDSVTQSSLNVVGTLVNLSVANAGISIGSSGSLRLLVDSSTPTIRSTVGRLNFDMGASGPDVSFVDSATALSLGGPNSPAILGDNSTNLGIPGYRFNNIYANNFLGNANSATSAVTATNLAGGGAGAIPYQTAAGTTAMLGLGAAGSVLTAQAGGLSWQSVSREPLRTGNYVNIVNTSTSGALTSYNGLIDATVSVDATPDNTAGKVVARDVYGNFAANIVLATLFGNVTGNVTGNSSTATKLQTARTINGVAFDGTANITITAIDATKVAKSGDSMTGYLTLNANPVNALHAAPKQYVDSRLPQYTFVSGAQYTYGYTNIVGSWSNDSNFFDLFPPSGKTMANLVAFIPSIHALYYAGGVNGDDATRCTYSYLSDRIRVYVQNTEQRYWPAANYLIIWS